MESRTCEYCGVSINLLRAGAKFCSAKHRVYASRRPTIPAEMTSKDRWVRRNKRKMPLTVDGRDASSTNPATWSSHSQAKASDVGSGIGFVLGEGIGCVDLDHCFDGAGLAAWAQEIVDQAPATYMEVSQSGEGLHIFGLLPEAPGRNIRRDGRNVEFYSRDRYIAVTGNRFADSPSKLADISELVTSLS